MARSRDQRYLKSNSAEARTSAHKLGRPVSTWSTPRQDPLPALTVPHQS